MPADQVIDRISGRLVARWPAPAVGRYIRQTGGTAAEYLTSPPERLDQGLPDAVTVEAVVAIGQRVAAVLDQGAPLRALADISPLIDGAAALRTLSRQPLETDIEEHLPYLRAVCFRPAARLRSLDRQVPVSRARTVTPRTIVRLAAHSEDWTALRPDGVRPDRVLTPERDIDIDLYENRVAARLVADLSRYLTLRVTQIRSISDMFSDIQRYIDDITGRHWQTSRRLWNLVAELADQADWQAQARLRLAELERLRAAVSALRASQVWHGVNRRAALASTLRSTNLLGNEDRYRHVAELWRRLVSANAANDSSDAAARRLQIWCTGFIDYVRVLFARAFDELGASPIDPVEEATDPIGYRIDGVILTLRSDPAGVFIVEQDGEQVLRIAPLPCALTASGTADTVASELATLADAAPQVPTLVLYPGSHEERQALPVGLRLRVYEAPATPAPDHVPGSAWLIPVSPMEIDSVIRVARALRWLVDQPRLSSYPHRVPCSPSTAADLAARADWLALAPDGLTVVRIPVPHELATARAHVVSTLRDTARFRRLGSNATEVQRLLDGIGDALEKTRELTRCPRCGTQPAQPERTLQPRDNGFRASCPACGAAWESRLCPTCGRGYPVLDVGGELPGILDGDQIDRRYGTDLLAAPCARRGRVFICPWCTTCGDAESEGTCVRCDRR